MDKQYILEEIRKTARENGGKPLGSESFQSHTGIKYYDWHGKYWVRWSDALKEAGFTPNVFNVAYADDVLLAKLCELIRELGHFPVSGELKLKANHDKSFPSDKAFNRLGNKRILVSKVVAYCQQQNMEDIIKLCPIYELDKKQDKTSVSNIEVIGSVYLIKSGKYYKIGRTNSMGRREYEIALQLPEKEKLIHEIKTDDPVGIENYWHNRFDKYRANGEWFELTQLEINAFKRRKFM